MADAGILEVMKPEEDASLEVFDGVAEQAAEQLGYILLKEKRDKLAARNRLIQALGKLGIPVYDPETVARYKAVTLKEARTAEWMNYFRFARWSIGLGAALIVVALGFFRDNRTAFLMMLAIGLFAFAISAIAAGATRDEARKIGWRKQFVSQHNTSEIPTFVLARALELRCECPGVNFEIDAILAEKIDPFLVAEAGGEHFYIAYWSEPGFRAVEQKI